MVILLLLCSCGLGIFAYAHLIQPFILQTPRQGLHMGHIAWAKKVYTPVADPGGVRGVQMHPPLATSNVFLRT